MYVSMYAYRMNLFVYIHTLRGCIENSMREYQLQQQHSSQQERHAFAVIYISISPHICIVYVYIYS